MAAAVASAGVLNLPRCFPVRRYCSTASSGFKIRPSSDTSGSSTSAPSIPKLALSTVLVEPSLFLTRRVVSEMESAEYPEDEYYRQYMSNPDFRHSRR